MGDSGRWHVRVSDRRREGVRVFPMAASGGAPTMIAALLDRVPHRVVNRYRPQILVEH